MSKRTAAVRRITTLTPATQRLRARDLVAVLGFGGLGHLEFNSQNKLVIRSRHRARGGKRGLARSLQQACTFEITPTRQKHCKIGAAHG